MGRTGADWRGDGNLPVSDNEDDTRGAGTMMDEIY